VAEDKREYGFADGYGDGEIVCDCDGTEFETVKELLDFLIENDYLSENDLIDVDWDEYYSFQDVLDMINDSDFYICGYKDIQNSIVEDTFFLTKKSCQKHIEQNHYHYKNPHTYAMTAWRNPEYERLLNIIKETDWENV